jgi:glucose/arabinose dehydrogenase
MKKIQSIFLPALVAGVASVFTAGVAFADDVFVSDNGDNSILEIAPDGTVSTFISNSSDLGGPTGLTFNSAGDLFVANNGTGTIAEFSSNGTFIGNYASGLQNPRALAFDSFGNLFVADQSSGRITEIPAGTVATPGGTNFAGSFVKDFLNFPNGIAFDSNGNLFVASGGGDFIEKLTFTGGVFNGATPFVTSGLNNPVGLATEGTDVFVMDNNTDSILEYDSNGNFVKSVVSDPSHMDDSKGLAIDSKGDFFVTNEGNGTVSEYDANGDFLATVTGFDGPNYIATLAVPEPSTYVLLTAGLGMLFFLGRRKVAARI